MSNSAGTAWYVNMLSHALLPKTSANADAKFAAWHLAARYKYTIKLEVFRVPKYQFNQFLIQNSSGFYGEASSYIAVEHIAAWLCETPRFCQSADVSPCCELLYLPYCFRWICDGCRRGCKAHDFCIQGLVDGTSLFSLSDVPCNLFFLFPFNAGAPSCCCRFRPSFLIPFHLGTLRALYSLRSSSPSYLSLDLVAGEYGCGCHGHSCVLIGFSCSWLLSLQFLLVVPCPCSSFTCYTHFVSM